MPCQKETSSWLVVTLYKRGCDEAKCDSSPHAVPWQKETSSWLVARLCETGCNEANCDYLPWAILCLEGTSAWFVATLCEVDHEELWLYLPRVILCLKETSSWLAATCPPGISPSESLPSVSYSEIGRCRVKIFLTSESVLPRLSDSETTWVGIRTCPTHFSLEFQVRRLGEVKVNVGEFGKVTCFR